MKILIPTGKSKNAIVTIAIGDEYYNKWINNSYPSWKRYCRRFDLGLIVVDQDLISVDDIVWKKPTWQKMLIAESLEKLPIKVNNVCYLDTDILINYKSPNIFDDFNSTWGGVVEREMPLNNEYVNKIIK